MYLLMLVFDWFLRYDMSLLTVASPTCNVCDISLWLYPLLQSSCTLSLLHCTCCSWYWYCSMSELKSSKKLIIKLVAQIMFKLELNYFKMHFNHLKYSSFVFVFQFTVKNYFCLFLLLFFSSWVYLRRFSRSKYTSV